MLTGTFLGKKLITQNKPTHSFSQVLEIKSEPCLVKDLLQGWSMVRVGISDKSAAKDVLGEVSFVHVIKADHVGSAAASVGKCVPVV